MRIGTAAVMAIAIAATLGLLGLSLSIAPAKSGQISNFFQYQGLSLGISFLVITLVRLVLGRKFEYLKLGDLSASATPSRLLGITAKENWQRVGLTFFVIISIATLGFMALQWFSNPAQPTPKMTNWLIAITIALPLSILNAFNEEIITRWAIVEGLGKRYQGLAPWASAALFGSVHYFGTPGGLIGVLMAGFLGWFLARSIQQTKGIGWAWLIHIAQDVIIFTFLLAAII